MSVSRDLDFERLQAVVERLCVEGVDVTVDAADLGLAVAPGSDGGEESIGGTSLRGSAG